MLNNITLPPYVAQLYNKASLECVQVLAEQGLRLELNNGSITGAYMIPDNAREV